MRTGFAAPHDLCCSAAGGVSRSGKVVLREEVRAGKARGGGGEMLIMLQTKTEKGKREGKGGGKVSRGI